MLYVYSVFAKARNVSGKFESGKNVISHNLEYKRAEDVNIRIKGVSTFLNGTKIEYSEGDGDERTINFFQSYNGAIKGCGTKRIEEIEVGRIRGSFETFGLNPGG